jgi:hypothetical protein
MNEILYISDTHRQSRNFLRELTDDLKQKEIIFKIDYEHFRLETNCYSVVCKPLNGGLLGCGYPFVKYIVNCTTLSNEDFHKRIGFMLKEDVETIQSRKQILSLLTGW